MNGLAQFVTLSNANHPACVEIFSDWGSFFHVAAGAVVATLPAEWALIVALAFTGYQISQIASGQSYQRTGGELIEFALGMAGMLVYEHESLA